MWDTQQLFQDARKVQRNMHPGLNPWTHGVNLDVCVASKVPREMYFYTLSPGKSGPGGSALWQGDSYTPTTVVIVLCNQHTVLLSSLMALHLLGFVLSRVLSMPCLVTVEICADNSSKPLNHKSSVFKGGPYLHVLPAREHVKCARACDSHL